MTWSRIMKWVTGGCEAFLGIPVIGGAFIFSTTWGILLVMFILHLAALLLAVRENRTFAGSVLGMVTSFVGVIPVLGMIMHIASAVMLLADAAVQQR